jgi:uncharacterized protein (TIGR04562 family)
MKKTHPKHELYHEIFGSIIDRDEMSPYFLLKANIYNDAVKQASRMMGNRGFDTYKGTDLVESEKKRALGYIDKAYRYCFKHLFPFLENQFVLLKELGTDSVRLYASCLDSISNLGILLNARDFKNIMFEDPRHIFLLASSRKFPHVFYGYKGKEMDIPPEWQEMACSILKVAYLIKSIEEDSQDINDYAQLGLFLATQGQSLDDLYNYRWEKPEHVPDSDSAQRAFVKVSTFFHKLREFVRFSSDKQCLVFNSGDGVDVDIMEIRARLKSPESMFTKLGKSVEGDVHDIRDVLAITFILKNRDDTLMLFHSLQKRGVILQENTISPSITQTLFQSPDDMKEAVRHLIISLSKSRGRHVVPDERDLISNAKVFFRALSSNASKNAYSSLGHNKFQCKINYSVPIHRNAETNEILIPGLPTYKRRHRIPKKTGQHTLDLELRISDRQSWLKSEQKGDAHHDAYKFRQMAAVMNRLFKSFFNLPEESLAQLREDQKKLFA